MYPSRLYKYKYSHVLGASRRGNSRQKTCGRKFSFTQKSASIEWYWKQANRTRWFLRSASFFNLNFSDRFHRCYWLYTWCRIFGVTIFNKFTTAVSRSAHWYWMNRMPGRPRADLDTLQIKPLAPVGIHTRTEIIFSPAMRQQTSNCSRPSGGANFTLKLLQTSQLRLKSLSIQI